MGAKRFNLIINGKEREGRDYFEVRNPYSGEVIGEVAYGGREEIEEVAEICERAFYKGELSETYKRANVLLGVKKLLEENSEKFTRTIIAEAGKPVRLSRGETRRALSTLEISAGEVYNYGGEVIPVDVVDYSRDYIGFYRYFPRGPVLSITPFNFPLNLVLHKLAPAIAVGAPVVLKPSPRTPITAYYLVDLFLKSGCPSSFIHFLPVPNELVGEMVDNKRFKVISFTGSADVGWSLKKRVWDRKVLLELGGNAAAVVHRDADIDWAAKRIVQGAFAYAGQICISVQRVYAHREIYKRFREKLIEETRNVKVGNPEDEDVIAGPMISKEACDRVEEWVEEAKKLGGIVVVGGERKGNIYYPTVIEGAPANARVVSEEVFGPLLVLFEYNDLEEAVSEVNNTKYGLQAGIFTGGIKEAMYFYEKVEVGGVVINDYPTFRVDNYPYGGVKASGYGREGIRYAMRDMSEMKMCIIRKS